jgi:outer membrane lipoprotein carrier protein
MPPNFGRRLSSMSAIGVVCVAIAATLLALAARAANQTDDSLHTLEERYRRATALQATFLERYSENGKQVRAEAGTAYFLRPGKMRWEYQAPENNVFLVDGKTVWFYAPADHTVTRMPARNSEDWRTPIAFLTTGMKLSRICSEVALEPTVKAKEAGDAVYRCALRSTGRSAERENKESAYFLFEVSPQSELSRIVVPQEGGLQIEFEFRNWQWNPVLPKSLFEFSPPMGTAIVNGVLPEAPGMRQ